MLKPLFVICRLSGMNCFTKSSKITKTYVCILVVFHFSILVFYSNFRRFDMMLHNILYDVVMTVLSLGCLVMTVSTEFYGKSTFLDELDFFDSHIGIPVPKRKLLLWIVLLCERLEMTVFLTNDMLTCKRMYGLDELKFHICYYIQLIMIGTSRIFIFWISNELCLRFSLLNNHLVKSFEDISERKRAVGRVQFGRSQRFLKTIRKISSLHNLLCDNLDLINECYGLTMLYEVLTALSVMVLYFTGMTNFIINKATSQFTLSYGLWCFLHWLVSI